VSILKGVETYVGLQVRDAKVIEHARTKQANIDEAYKLVISDQIDRYGTEVFGRVFESYPIENTSTKINAYENQIKTAGTIWDNYKSAESIN
jgi:hypothetical protein